MTRTLPWRPSLLRRALATLALAATALASDAQAQSPRERLLVTPAWLAEHQDDANLVLLHVGETNEYARAHIPGARLVRLDDVSAPHDHDSDELALEMSTAEALREQLQALGISNDSRIIVYYSGQHVSPATRVLLTLAYAGLDARASLLDGGMPAWRAEGRPVTDRVPAARRGTLSPLRLQRDLIVDADWVRRNASAANVALIDGRAAVFYDGVQATRQRKGHIPGARSIPFTAINDAQGRVKSAAELAELFRRAGVKPGDTVVGYCHIGMQATQMLFAARTLGYDVKLYDGSFQDWDARTDLPVETATPSRGGRR